MYIMLGTGQSLLVNATYFTEGITKETVLC